MKEVVDLYARMVIGTFAFIGPSFTLLIPLFYPAFEKSRAKHDAMLKNLRLAISEDIKVSSDLSNQIRKGKKNLNKLEAENKTQLNLLKPKRQVRRLFISLFISIIFIAIYYLVCDNTSLKAPIIFISGLSYVYSLFVLWQVFSTVIKIKSEEEEEKEKAKKRIFLKPNIKK